MLDRAASAVLLVKSVEDVDRTGAVLPFADREHASRETLRDLRLTGDGLRSESARGLSRALRARAGRLLEPLQARHPALKEVLDRGQWPSWISALALGAALLAGLALSALDGTQRIDILAVPFLGVIAWNLLVYLALGAGWLRSRVPQGTRARRSIAGAALARVIVRPLQSLARRVSGVHAALGEAVTLFVTKWTQDAAPLLIHRIRRLYHLGSAALALGLLAGLYVRGIALRYEAGWDSTFLSPDQVRRVIEVLYALPAALAGISLPQTEAAVSALRWNAAGRGVNAAPWIHLIGASLLLYVMLPRLVLAGISAWREWRLRSAPPAGEMLSYARRVFGVTARGTTELNVQVVPYACELQPAGRTELVASFEARFGPGIRTEVSPVLAYGDEELAQQTFAGDEASRFDGRVLLFSLAATPEPENHGSVIKAAREASERSPTAPLLLVAIDESGFLARFGTDPSLERRLQERRALWRDFVARYGLEAWMVDLGRTTRARNLAPA